MYYTNIRRYFDIFPKKNIKVILFDDFSAKINEVLREIFLFLKVDETFKPEIDFKHNIGGVPKSSTLYSILKYRRSMHHFKPYVPEKIRKFYRKVRDNNLVKAPPLSSEIRRQLGEIFEADILQLQEILKKDLSDWI
jgi:hypothetical protein